MIKEPRADAISEAPNPRWLPSDGILLAFSSAAAYAFAFVYETGYADHFGYPYWMIEVSWINVLVAWSVLLLALLMVSFFAFAVADLLPASVASRVGKAIAVPFGLLFALALFGWVLMAWPGRYWEGLFLLTFAAVMTSLFVIALRRYYLETSKVEPWSARWVVAARKFESAQRASKQRASIRVSIADALLPRQVFGRPLSLIGGWFLFLSFLLAVAPALLGRLSTRLEEPCLVTHRSRDWVAVRRYGDKILAMPLDLKSMKITRSYALFPSIDTGQVWSSQGVCRLGLLPLAYP